MAQNARSKNRRVAVRETVGDTVRLQPATPLTATARSSGADAAFALASALQVGGTLQQSRDIRMSQQAEADFQRGEVDENEGNRAYRRSVETLNAKARWYEDRSEFEERLRDIDLTDVTYDELNGMLDGWFSDKYGDLEDPQVSAGVLEAMTEFRADINERAYNTQVVAERAQIDTSLKTIAEAHYDPENLGEFDYESYNQEIQTVLPGAEGNATYWNTIRDMAIRNGDPDLIRNAPDRWADGTPTYTGNPDNAESVLNAENRAIAERLRIDRANQEAVDSALEEEHRQLTVSAAIKAVHGQGFDDEILALLGNPNFDSNDVTSLYAAGRAGLREQEARSWNPEVVTGLWAQNASGNISVIDVVEAHQNGLLGYGPQSASLAESMIRMADQQARAAATDTTGTFQNYRTLLNNRYNRQQDGPLAAVDPKMGPLNVEANELYLRLQVDEGLSPRDAYDRVVEQFDPVADRIKAGISDAGSQRTQATVHGLSVSPQEVQSYLDGNLPLVDFMGGRSGEEFLIQIGNAGLPQEDLDAVALKYIEDIAALESQQ